MRSDFQKLLCECYKTGRGGAMSSKHIRTRIRSSKNQEDGEFYSPKINRRKIIGWNHKSFGENLAPLKRYLRKQVGRPWNKVYSEISKYNSKAGAVGVHIFQHLFDYIEVKVFWKDGQLHVCNGWMNKVFPGSLYVDPDDGIIKVYKKNEVVSRKKKWRRKPTDIYRYDIGEDGGILLHKGVWFFFSYEDVPPARLVSLLRDGKMVKVWDEPIVRCMALGLVTAKQAKRYIPRVGKQLNSKELQQFGLKNVI